MARAAQWFAPQMSKLRIGVLGTARIAGGFVYHQGDSPLVEVVAVASRTAARAEAFAKEYSIARACDYQGLLHDPDVDAVYLPLPNSLHAEWAIAAARAGKHVLCEKPLATSEADAKAMFAAADASGVVLLEAFPFHFQPQTLEVQRLVAEGAIGEVRTAQATFSFNLAGQADIRLDPLLGGGALFDVGCYPVSLLRLLFGRRPERVSAVARWAESGVDRTLAGTIEYPGSGIGQISCSFASAVHRQASVTGSAGVIETDYQNHTDRQEAPSIRLRRGTGWTDPFVTLPVPRQNGFTLEAEAFARMVESGDRAAERERRAASLDNQATLRALLESARSERPVSLPDGD
jgi:D-xylose 1-dehydrogenase (NADP+, D-xylono-1,5-lactone-forming)